MTQSQTNPLLSYVYKLNHITHTTDTSGSDLFNLPDFAKFTPTVITEALEALLPKLQEEFSAIEEAAAKISLAEVWQKLIEPLEIIGYRLELSWGVVGHLLAVMDSAELREIYKTLLPKVITFSQKVSQSRPVYDLLLTLSISELFSTYTEPKRRLINSKLLSAKLSGVGLDGEKLERFNVAVQELAALAQNFNENILDDLSEAGVVVKSLAELEGVSDDIIANARKRYSDFAVKVGNEQYNPEDNFFYLPLDPTNLRLLLQSCKIEKTREVAYLESLKTAANEKRNNLTVIEKILKLKLEVARLLDFPNTAEMYLATKMAKTSTKVLDFLSEIAAFVEPHEKVEFTKLTNLAQANSASTIKQWDLLYWMERLNEQELGFSAESLRPFFKFEVVLKECFNLFNRLFTIDIEDRTETTNSVWHPDVRFYVVKNERGQEIAGFYLDPYLRPGLKRSGAWVNKCQSRFKLTSGEKVLPVVYVVCNQPPPTAYTPSLMSFYDVETLLHEFGHALHHMLAIEDSIGASTLELSEWDSVEIASQFLEAWSYDRETVKSFACHYHTGEALDDKLIDALEKSRTFLRGIHYIRQLHLSLTDIKLFNSEITSSSEALDLYHNLGQMKSLPPHEKDRMLCSFSHIFGGGYTAGYYSYLWSEVYSLDLYYAFKEKLKDGLPINEVGLNFRQKVLSKIGSYDVENCFEDFVGRKLSLESFLKFYFVD
jgi:oligopeptidase A